MRLLCVTDDRNLADKVKAEARRLQWAVDVAEDITTYSHALEAFNPEMILVDTNDNRIFEWWKVKKPAGQPVVFVKPLEGELRATFDRIERLQGQRHFPRYNLHIDSERQVARIGHRRLPLTLTELRLLRELAAMDYDVVARDALEGCISGVGGARRRALDVHICALRKKLRAVGLMVESVRGVGYRLNPCPP